MKKHIEISKDCFCGAEGTVHLCIDDDSGVYYKYCTECGSEYADAEVLELNTELMIKFTGKE
jgi:hypothetical protein